MVQLINLTCKTCGREFEGKVSEHNRRIKAGKAGILYCSRKCYGKDGIKNIPISKRVPPPVREQRDQYSPFRNLFKTARRHATSGRHDRRLPKDFTITLDDLLKQWNEQSGICPLTGWGLKVPETSRSDHGIPTTPDKASIDRIDSNKGYVPGNIRFVALMAQYAKNGWTDEDVKIFCRAVTEHESHPAKTLQALPGANSKGSPASSPQHRVLRKVR